MNLPISPGFFNVFHEFPTSLNGFCQFFRLFVGFLRFHKAIGGRDGFGADAAGVAAVAGGVAAPGVKTEGDSLDSHYPIVFYMHISIYTYVCIYIYIYMHSI